MRVIVEGMVVNQRTVNELLRLVRIHLDEIEAGLSAHANKKDPLINSINNADTVASQQRVAREFTVIMRI